MHEIKSAPFDSPFGEAIKICSQQIYEEAYGARIKPSPDEFIYLHENGTLLASFGLTYRRQKPLFSEYYLERPLNEEVDHRGDLVSVEVGTCISLRKGFGYKLYKLLPYILKEKNTPYALVTITNKVRSIFDSLNFSKHYLAEAYESSVPAGDTWGTFYQDNPQTFIFDALKSSSSLSLKEFAFTLGIKTGDMGETFNQNNILYFRNKLLIPKQKEAI
tara:strand:- start:341 stop:994 length:654 start_codon:yes stop_codon:yes gene_type:complete